MAALTLFTNPMSRGQIARWMLEEVGEPYETVILDYETSMKAPDFLAINPMGKVPAIRHDDRIVTECAAICVYLAEVFPRAGLGPAAAEKADYYRWLFFAAGPLEQAVTNRAAGWEPPSDREKMFGYGNYDRVVDVLDALFRSRPYVCGNRYTAADVYLGAHISWGLQFKTLPECESFTAYSHRLTARDAFNRAKSIDDALIAEAQARLSPQAQTVDE